MSGRACIRNNNASQLKELVSMIPCISFERISQVIGILRNMTVRTKNKTKHDTSKQIDDMGFDWVVQTNIHLAMEKLAEEIELKETFNEEAEKALVDSLRFTRSMFQEAHLAIPEQEKAVLVASINKTAAIHAKLKRKKIISSKENLKDLPTSKRARQEE
eukprot:TRINITY_DN21293_c0_g1_i1.p1 TRINITY_DN21293_c0_g1~~TRINITY_DN21293_c0_g1_i1.p1  ORF type:complete len:184 (+),score=43.19 TRINITY_DN21293_c0_g1_i1:74-553(+)